MTIEQWLLKLDPSSFSLTTLIWGMFVFTALFIWKKWWPQYTTFTAPQQSKLAEKKVVAEIDAQAALNAAEIDKDRRQTAAMEGIYQVLVEMRSTMTMLRENDKLSETMLRMVLDRIDPLADKPVGTPKVELKP